MKKAMLKAALFIAVLIGMVIWLIHSPSMKFVQSLENGASIMDLIK